MRIKFILILAIFLSQALSLTAQHLPGKFSESDVFSLYNKSNNLNILKTAENSVLANQFSIGAAKVNCSDLNSPLAPTAVPCNGASVTSIVFNNASRTIVSGVNNRVGVVYRYSNAGTAPDGTVLDALVTVLSYSNNQDADQTNFSDADVPAATAGYEDNLQPSINQESGTFLNNSFWQGSLNYRIQFVRSGTTTPKVITVAATTTDNDGASVCGSTLRESVTYSNALNQILIDTPNATTQTVSGNVVTGPTTNQANIGSGSDYASAALYINVSEIQWAYSFTTPTNAQCTAGAASSARYGSLNLSCQITFDQPFVSVPLSGTVFNDANGLTDSTVNGTGTNAGGLFANLLDANNNVVSTAVVAANGVYTFPTAFAGSYSVQISTNRGVESSPAPVAALPAGWVNTGENLGAGAGNDGTVNGLLPVTVAAVSIANANFGIEQRPVANTNTAANQLNPGGTNNVAVPATTFSATDGAPGIVANIRITAFPSNATSITINGTQYTSGNFPAGGVTVPTNASGNPTQPILVDPIDGATTVGISYVALDNAGVVSSAAATANVPFVTVSISGNVLNDVNGLTDSIVNGTGTNAGGGLYANLLNGSNVVVQTVIVPASGAYSFSNVSGGNYTVQISTNQGTVGSAAPAAALPAGWVATGEFVGTAAGNDGSANSLLAVSIAATTSVVNANFGIEQRPTANNNTAASQTNPGGTARASVPAGTFTATDPSTGTIANIRITAFPTNTTSLTVGTTTYYATTAAIPTTCPTATCAAFPAGGVTIAANGNGNPTSAISVDPINGAVTVVITYAAIDNANVESAATATASVPFATVAVSGAVFNDANGLTDSLVNGIVPNTGATLYANLLDANGVVLQSVTVSTATGLYNFANLDSGSYTIQISTNQGTVGSAAPAPALPAGWVNTGEFVGTGIGNDGAVNGLLPVNVAAAAVGNANFGIEQRPVANTNTAANQLNPGGTNNVAVPATTFSATDGAPGIVANIRITAFPSNATSITINGTQYTSGNFPAGGVTVPTNASGNPTQPILVDPINGATTVGISYVAIDNAGIVSSATATANVPFIMAPTAGEVTIGGRVTTATGRGVNRARVTLTDSNGAVRVAATNTFGYYRFVDVAAGETLVMSVKDKRYVFDNPAQVVSVNEDRADINFVARDRARGEESKQDKSGSAPFDFDGDNKTDVAVYRPSNQTWYILQSASGTLRAEQFPVDAGDKIAPADYDGDKIADLAVYNAESKIWTILQSSNGETQRIVVGFGETNAGAPVAADYDGDGKADIALDFGKVADLEIKQSSNGEFVRRASESIVRENRTASENSSAIILRGDFDGDGLADAATFDKGVWTISSSAGLQENQISFGLEGDIPAPSAYLPKIVKSKKAETVK